jgi:hypothetical protein
VEQLEASGRERTPRLVKWAVQATRTPKQQEAADSLYGWWRAEAAERGHDPDTLVRQVKGRALTEPGSASMRPPRSLLGSALFFNAGQRQTGRWRTVQAEQSTATVSSAYGEGPVMGTGSGRRPRPWRTTR